MRPVLYLLCGKVGSGKSTFAQTLSSRGVISFSQDALALEKAKDFRKPDDHYRVVDLDTLRRFEAEARDEILKLVLTHLKNGSSVVLDDGFWQRSERDKYRKLGESVGATVVIYYFPIEDHEQWKRLNIRNEGDLRYQHYISLDDMKHLNQYFEAPSVDEGVTIDPWQGEPEK